MASLHRALLVSFYPAPNFLWDPACKAKVIVPASTQCIHGEIIILECLKRLFEPSLNYFSGNRSGLNMFIPLPLWVLVCIRWALVTDEKSHHKVFSPLRHCSCFHISSLDKINKNQERTPWLDAQGGERRVWGWRTHQGFPGGAVVKNLLASAGDARDVGSIPGSGRSPGGGNDNPLQYSCPENSMARGTWQATLHRVPKSWTRLSVHAHTHTQRTHYGETREEIIIYTMECVCACAYIPTHISPLFFLKCSRYCWHLKSEPT